MKKMIKKFLYLFKKKKYLHIDFTSYIDKSTSILRKKQLSIGKSSYIGADCTIMNLLSPVIIGNYVMVGPQVMMITGNHRTDVIGEYMINVGNDLKLPENDQPIIIDDDVWIGARAIILKGVTIGKGSIIGAGAIVTKNVPPYSIYVGNKVIKARFNEEQIIQHEKLLKEKYGGQN